MDTTIIENKFKSLFGNEYRVYTSPGRINLIGEHTDYNGGFVFPGAIDKGIYAAIQPNGTDKVRAFSIDYNAYIEFRIQEEDCPDEAWARYIFGVCREIQKEVLRFTASTLSLLVMCRLEPGCHLQLLWKAPLHLLLTTFIISE